jgi:cupin fold WbuC family metalloprotein
MKLKIETDEVSFAIGQVIKIAKGDLLALSEQADRVPRHRARICTHVDSDDPLHEMLICLTPETYTPVHRHAVKSESFHVIYGRAAVVLWNQDGTERERIEMGNWNSGLTFYYRLNASIYHSLEVHTKYFIFHESTNGPWTSGDMLLAPWEKGPVK